MSGVVTPAATLSIGEAANRAWDIGIVGAGVAGASLAIRLARRGLSVLLVEAQRFPREKVCGGCLNQRALDLLRELGLLDQCTLAGAVPLQWLRIRQGERDHRWRVPEMLSLRRSTLDALLVKAAIGQGVAYLDGTTATLESSFTQASEPVVLQLRSASTAAEKAGQQSERWGVALVRIAVVAAGLTRSPLINRTAWPAEVAPNSRIGVQCLIPAELLRRQEWSWSQGLQLMQGNELRMLIGSRGYLGISRTDGDYYDFAAALDPAAIRSEKSIEAAIDRLLVECALPALGKLNPNRWASTPHLTRASWPVARDRVFLLGDSMGYVEPFTGEGMSWGLAGAKRLDKMLGPVLGDSSLSQSAAEELESGWNRWAAGQRRRNQSVCRWVAGQVRRPTRAAWLLTGLDWLPPVRNMILRKATR
ncbi:MAG: NAD(P)/FAD-dependent oxidoreductase [Planctomycetota bacterium]